MQRWDGASIFRTVCLSFVCVWARGKIALALKALKGPIPISQSTSCFVQYFFGLSLLNHLIKHHLYIINVQL